MRHKGSKVFILLISLSMLVLVNNSTKISLGEEKSYITHDNSIYKMFWSPDGSYISTYSVTDKVVKIWDVSTKEPIWIGTRNESTLDTNFIWNYQSDKLIIIDRVYPDVIIEVIDFKANKSLHKVTYSDNTIGILGTYLSEDDKLLIYKNIYNSQDKSKKGEIGILDLSNLEFSLLIEEDEYIYSTIWYDNGNKIVYYTQNKTDSYLKIWDQSTKSYDSITRLHVLDVFSLYSKKPSLKVSPDEKYLAVSYRYEKKAIFTTLKKSAVKIYDLTNVNKNFAGSLYVDSQIMALDWKNNQELFVGTRDNGTYIWNIDNLIINNETSNKDYLYLFNRNQGIVDFEWQKDQKKLAVVFSDEKIATIYKEVDLSSYIVAGKTSNISFPIILITFIIITVYNMKYKRRVN